MVGDTISLKWRSPAPGIPTNEPAWSAPNGLRGRDQALPSCSSGRSTASRASEKMLIGRPPDAFVDVCGRGQAEVWRTGGARG